MAKYIRVIEKIDNINKKIILRFNDCNDCPLMRFDSKKLEVKCLKFSNEGNKTINDFVVEFDDYGDLTEIIDTPKWCQLDNTIDELDNNTKAYFITESGVFISNDNVEKNLPVYDKSFLNRVKKNKNKKTKLPQDFLPNIISNHFNNMMDELDNEKFSDYDFNNSDNIFDFNDVDPMNQEFDWLTNNTPSNNTNRISIELCSHCNGYSVETKRDINNGMCDSCFEKHGEDEHIMKQTFIKNFRIKRGVKNNNYDFKIIEQ